MKLDTMSPIVGPRITSQRTGLRKRAISEAFGTESTKPVSIENDSDGSAGLSLQDCQSGTDKENAPIRLPVPERSAERHIYDGLRSKPAGPTRGSRNGDIRRFLHVAVPRSQIASKNLGVAKSAVMPQSTGKRSGRLAGDEADQPAPKRAREQTKGGASAKATRVRATRVDPHGWKRGSGLNLHLAPMNDIGAIFTDMTDRALDLGLRDILPRFKSRVLNVATMCSGTESPMLALEMICSRLGELGHKLRINHVFSAEIEPFKQAYIERNFKPKILFRDIEEVAADKIASTAYGVPTPVPPRGSVDLLVAGFACVDYSNLNNKKKMELVSSKSLQSSNPSHNEEAGLEGESGGAKGLPAKEATTAGESKGNEKAREAPEAGESSATLHFILEYIDKYRPPLVILENVLGAPWEMVCQKLEETAYLPLRHRLDTKDYYLPHTRLRGYLIAINVEGMAQKQLQPVKTATMKWCESMTLLERPASSPVEAFLLDELDPRLHRARVAIAGGQEDDDRAVREVQWDKCQSRHLEIRNSKHLGSGRPVTEWIEHGPSRMVDYGDAIWMRQQVPRIKDTLDISFLRAAYRGYDVGYKPRYPDLSQNVDRHEDTGQWGIAGCITPSGIPYSSFRGGQLVGLEALAMQGLPIDRLYLTRETQRNLQDLAGNAMSSTVVGAALLSALISSYQYILAHEPPSIDMSGESEDCNEEQAIESRKAQAASSKEHRNLEGDMEHLSRRSIDFGPSQKVSASVLERLASNSIRRCLCEGQFGNTRRTIYICRKCGHTACQQCRGIPKHSYVELSAEESAARTYPQTFTSLIKAALPTRLTIDKLSWSSFEDCYNERSIRTSDWDVFKAALRITFDEELRFHSVIRSEIWSVWYEASHMRLELRFAHGKFHWELYVKTSPLVPANARIRQLLDQPVAHMTVEGNDILVGTWKLCLPTTTSLSIEISGKGSLVASWKSRLGLDDYASEQVWSSLQVSVKDKASAELKNLNIAGEYQLHPNCGTACGALHQKFVAGKPVDQFLFLDPEREGAPENDEFVFSSDIRRLNYKEHRFIDARVGGICPPSNSWVDLSKDDINSLKKWRPGQEEKQTVLCTVYGTWIPCEAVIVPVAETAILSVIKDDFDAHINKTTPHPFTGALNDNRCADEVRQILTCTVPQARMAGKEWNVHQWTQINPLNERQLFGSIAWLTERSTKLLKFSPVWRRLTITNTHSQCQECAPRRPNILWELDSKHKMVPYEDPAHTGPYERAMKAKPSPLCVYVRRDTNDKLQLIVDVNLQTLAHRAVAKLLSVTPEGSIEVIWRLDTQYQPGELATLPKFTLPSNKTDLPRPHTFPNRALNGSSLSLRAEQQRSLQWMVSREAPDVPPFHEQASAEFCEPNLGWRLESQARRPRVVRGGVLADEVGYGKTITTLALIDCQQAQAKSDARTLRRGKLSIKATLIVASQTLVVQWRSEIKKFLGGGYKVLVIKDIIELRKLQISDYQSADIVIVSSSMFQHEKYMTRLSRLAAMPEVPKNPQIRALDAWMTCAVERAASQVEDLQAVPFPRKFGATLFQRLKDSSKDEDLLSQVPSQVPSKRHRGSDYLRERQRKRVLAKMTPAARAKQKSVEIPPLGDYSEKKDDIFDLDKSKTIGHLRGPVFQIFHWHRIVIDEYATEKERAFVVAMKSLHSTTRWILSGTPPLGDFADIKFIASFFNLNLGEVDGAAGALKSRNAKFVGVDRTPAEKFEACQNPGSTTSCRELSGYAQSFLNEFVRQNTAEIDEIKAETHFLPVLLDGVQYAIYIESKMQLLAQDMMLRKGNRSSLHNDRTRRQDVLFKNSNSAEEALMKRASHFQLDEEAQQPDDAISACLMIIQERELEMEDLCRDIEERLRYAKALQEVCGSDEVHYMRWLNHVNQGEYGDAEATKGLQDLIERALPFTGDLTKVDWTFRTKDFGEDEGGKVKTDKKTNGKKSLPKTTQTLRGKMVDSKIEDLGDGHNRRSTREKKPVLLTELLEEDDTSLDSETDEEEETLDKRPQLSSRVGPKTSEQRRPPLSSSKAKLQAQQAGEKSQQLKRKRTNQDRGDPEASETQPVAKRPKTGTKFRKGRKPDERLSSDEEWNSDGERLEVDDDADEIASANIEDEDPAEAKENVFEPHIYLRRIKDKLHRWAAEHTARTRALRFIQNVQKIQLWQVGQRNSPNVSFPAGCRHNVITPDQLYVLGQCGHTSCKPCMSSRTHPDKCLIEGCRAPALDYHLVPANDLHTPALETPQHKKAKSTMVVPSFGCKIDEIIRVVKEVEAKGEQALLFVQFDDLMNTISMAFDTANISHHKVDQYAALKAKGKLSGSSMLEDFKVSSKDKKTVLMLNSGDASAAGHNLTNANHVLFVSPLLAPSRYEYDSIYTQAIGRARRYGQSKTVHVYHFLSLKTIDIDLLEKRNLGKKAVYRRPGNTFELVAVADLTEREKSQNWAQDGFDAPEVRDDSDEDD